MINVDLMRRTLDHIEAHPETWNQNEWVIANKCGTSYCFAGHAALLAGVEIRNGGYIPLENIPEQYRELVDAHCEFGLDVGHIAEAILGLDENQAAELFYSDNDLEELRRIVDRICATAEAGASA